MTIPAGLRFALETGPQSVKDLTRAAGLSESRIREILKEHVAEVKCKKHETNNVNLFWIDPVTDNGETGVDPFEATPEELAKQTVRPHRDDDVQPETQPAPVEVPVATPAEPENSPAPVDTPTETESTDSDLNPHVEGECPFCQADVAAQKPAGEAGTYLGEARTCDECHRTYNVHTGTEIKQTRAQVGTKAKRVLLHTQPKINAKVEAVKAAGGTLVYDKATRDWVLNLRGKETRMKSKDFAVESPETLLAK